MISPRKLAANRANARVSTGPRTPSGKSRVARNALRHGLSLPVMSDPAMVPALEALVAEMVGGEEDPGLRACATAVAEAQLDLVRIRGLRHELMRTLCDQAQTTASLPPETAKGWVGSNPKAIREMLAPVPGGRALQRLEKPARTLSYKLQMLAKIDRYERRALSRRKFAIREFDATWAAHKAVAYEHRITPPAKRPNVFRITVRLEKNIPLAPRLFKGVPAKINIVVSSEASWRTSNIDEAVLNKLKRQLGCLRAKLRLGIDTDDGT